MTDDYRRRDLIGQAWPTPVGRFPWATFTINVTGCALIGVLMVLITNVWLRQRPSGRPADRRRLRFRGPGRQQWHRAAHHDPHVRCPCSCCSCAACFPNYC